MGEFKGGRAIILRKERQRRPDLTESAGVPVPGMLKARFENMSGISFEDVKIHYSSPHPSKIGAYAYTSGRNGLKMNDSISLEQEAYMLGNKVLQKKRNGSLESSLIQMCPKPGDARPAPDSEDELESFCSESDIEDNYNVASESVVERRSIRHVSNEEGRIVSKAKIRGELVKDARYIHSILKGKKFSGNTTVVCAVLKLKNGFLHIAMVNDALMMRKMRIRAEKLGYTIIRGIQTHAEANMILYAHKHRKDARLIAFGCDKDTCPKCAEILNECSTAKLEFTERSPNKDGAKKYSRTYYFKSSSKKPKGNGSFVRQIRRIINRNYDEGGRWIDAVSI